MSSSAYEFNTVMWLILTLVYLAGDGKVTSWVIGSFLVSFICALLCVAKTIKEKK